MKTPFLIIEVFTADQEAEIVKFELPVTIGRDSGCDLTLSSHAISRRHLRIGWNEQFQLPEISDLGSANGTLLDNQAIRKSHWRLNQVVTLGEFELTLIEIEMPKTEPHDIQLRKIMTEVVEVIRERILEEIEDQKQDLQTLVLPWIQELLQEYALSAELQGRALIKIQAILFGLGDLEPLVQNQEIDEIMVNGSGSVFVEESGKISPVDVKFTNDQEVLQIIERIILPLGKRIDESSPMVDARLSDGSRVNAIIPPLSLNGPILTIRKFKQHRLTIDQLIQSGSLSLEMAEFLEKAVQNRLNIVVSGGTGSGKTTLLNLLSNFIFSEERVITIEDAAELQLVQPHVVRLETRTANAEGSGVITIRDLLRNSLRMRPDRIVVGECRGGEALDMLQAMNTGHDGSLTTVHANSPRDALSRIETMCLMADLGLPHLAIREQIVRAVHLVVQQSRFHDGSRKVTEIAEVMGVESGTPTLQTLFYYDRSLKQHIHSGFNATFLQAT